MSTIFFAGLNASKLVFSNQVDSNGSVIAIDKFTCIADDKITDIEIGWDYFLIWKNGDLYISGKITDNSCENLNKLLHIPQRPNIKFKQAIAGPEKVTILTDNHDIWLYNIYNDTWEEVPSTFISNVLKDERERVVKISQGRCTAALTNFGRVFNIPTALNNPDEVKFIDVACGYDHTLLLTESGDIYSIGMGTRGQLGHGDLEDCDEPKQIEALAGLKVVQISAYGWHSAVVTDQGDLYTWGWNNQGQLGHPNIENVTATPTLVDFKDANRKVLELNINKVECGSAFTICKTDDGNLWGCGSNKYGQLGTSRAKYLTTKEFILLEFDALIGTITDLKCREWGSCIYVLKN